MHVIASSNREVSVREVREREREREREEGERERERKTEVMSPWSS